MRFRSYSELASRFPVETLQYCGVFLLLTLITTVITGLEVGFTKAIFGVSGVIMVGVFHIVIVDTFQILFKGAKANALYGITAAVAAMYSVCLGYRYGAKIVALLWSGGAFFAVISIFAFSRHSSTVSE